MRIGCLRIEAMAARLEQHRQGLVGQPLLVIEGARVLDPSPEAREAGVLQGERLGRALARSPEARLVSADRAYYMEVWEAFLDTLGNLSPAVEGVGWGEAYLEATGLGALFGGEADWLRTILTESRHSLGIDAQMGLASSRYAAWIAARNARFPPGYELVLTDDRSYLTPLPLHWLPLPSEAARRARLLGFRTLGQFAALPAGAVAEQFGADCLVYHRWARGEDRRPVKGQHQRVYEAERAFDPPETRREALVRVLVSMGAQALENLPRVGLAMQRLHITLALAEGKALDRSWAWDNAPAPQTLERTIRVLFDRLPPQEESAGVVAVRLQWIGTASAHGRQLELFAHDEGKQRLSQSLVRLAAKHPPESIRIAHSGILAAPLLKDRYILEGWRA